jgi:regulatory factor X 4
MACYPGQPPPLRPEELDPLSDSEADYKDFSAVQQNCHSTQVIVKWLELNYHYEEGVCLPRSTIYEHYVDFCERENIQPVINAASFGKLIRQQFSSLTTRRLGTRGKSKYHYFGLGIKPTSLYYNEEYFKRQKEGLSRKEPDSKKVHPVYPKENPSAVLPPFPDINQLKVQQEVPKDKLATFMVMYRTHCQRILDSVSRANFNEVEDFLLHFWQAMPPHLLPIMASTVVVDLVALCDTILYSVISSVLIISPVQSFPESLLQDVLKFCGQLGPWLDTALTGLPEALRHIKQKSEFLAVYSTVLWQCLGKNFSIQWNLQTRDTMRPTILSLVERSSISQRSNNRLKY